MVIVQGCLSISLIRGKIVPSATAKVSQNRIKPRRTNTMNRSNKCQQKSNRACYSVDRRVILLIHH